MNLEDMMADLREGYVADLPNKIKIIEEALKAKNLDEVRDGFHKLKGTGKTYGIPEITELCALMEELCINLKEQADTFTPLGLSLLNKIHSHRSQEKAFDLHPDPEFKRCQALFAGHSA